MTRALSRYGVFVKLAIQNKMSFRADFWAGIGEALLTFCLGIYLWRAIYAGREELAGMSYVDMTTYLIVAALVRGALSGSPIAAIGSAYMSGANAADMLKPLSYPMIILAREAAEFALHLLFRGLPVFFAGVAFVPFHVPEFVSLPLFCVSLCFAFLLNFLLQFLVAQLVVYIHTWSGLTRFWAILVTFSTGALVPLPFFPPLLRDVLYCLPFHGMFYTPVTIFRGTPPEVSPLAELIASATTLPATAAMVLEQAAWCGVLALLAQAAWRCSSQRFMAQGG
ncbi:MAG TPA: hypothetical protein VEJ63_23220 [Planctomycetota bacterium]|nr:hypothetical protein [Planctomycetota bacterium]